MQVFGNLVPHHCIGVGNAQLGRVCPRPGGKPIACRVLTLKNEVFFARPAAAPVCRITATAKSLGLK